MKNLIDEELVLNYCISCMELVLNYSISCMEFDRDTDVPPEGVKKNMLLQKELLSRLARGRKAMEALDSLTKEVSAIMHGEHGLDWADDFGPLFNMIMEAEKIINDYQQSKEVEG